MTVPVVVPWHRREEEPFPVLNVSVPDDREDVHDDELRRLVEHRRLRERARRYVEQEDARAAFVEPRTTFTLADELAILDEPLAWTIEDLALQGFNVSVTAQYKTGKTTLLANLLKSLVDQEPFLGALAVRPLAGRVAFLNYELDDRLFREWLRALGIKRLDRAAALNLRGYKLDLETDVARDWLIRYLRERDVQVMVVDPFARAFGGEENDNAAVIRWTDNLDWIKREAGVEDCFITLHTGRSDTERSRGATRIDDWADALWLLTKNGDGGSRYLAAQGRNVDFGERQLSFDPVTLRLSLGAVGTSRKAAKQSGAVDAVLAALLVAGDGSSVRQVRLSAGINNKVATDALHAAVAEGLLRTEDGARGATLHYFTDAGRARIEALGVDE